MTQEQPRSLFLTGFMGAGKSAVGKCLAELAGMPFFDLDDLLVRREQCSINEIFTTRGEDAFRNVESSILMGLDPSVAGVYATGGGIVLRAENRRRMHELGYIVFLQAAWQTLVERLEGNTERPLVNQHRNLETLRQLWLSRQPLYQDADLTIDTDGLTAIQVAERIVACLRNDEVEA